MNRIVKKSVLHSIKQVFCLCCVIVIMIQCGEDEPIMMEPEMELYEQEFPITYATEFPEGKLPYPHHHPDLTQNEYDALVINLFIINNFGLYQGGETEESCYFHDGLDFVLDNGTPIFALEAGTVRANIGGDQYYRTLVVEDADEPGYAWTYTHIFNFQTYVDNEVSKGQFLGRVNFKGLEHIHLNRTRLREGGSWDVFNDLINIYPDDYFTFIDETEPIIKTPFHYFKNQTDSLFASEEAIATISGEVDIVVSMRDGGAYASDFIGNSGYWGDRLAVRDVSYRILKEGEEIISRKSFDFRDLEFAFHSEKWKETLTVFKHANVLDIDAGSNNMFHSHYILTNAREGHKGSIDPSDGNLSWNTLEKDSTDQFIFENGEYTIEVTAHDSNGNKTVKSDIVKIQN